ncbi:MAG TPA: sigma-54 dependent transcriptional regulator [Syntrophobacteraceae bacterium]|nr:sigma-54 dependent transcriptional regulator [Syntrophobacteraceae bacterium]
MKDPSMSLPSSATPPGPPDPDSDRDDPKPVSRLLIVDDEEDMLRLLKRSLPPDLACEVETASNALRAFEVLEAAPFDVVLADIRMPGMDGMEFLERLQKEHGEITVVMMTAYGTIDLAVQAIKSGAYDFITKPFEHEKLVHLLERALERSRLVHENLRLQRRLRDHESFQEIIGAGSRMQKVFEMVRLVSKTDVTVLITGESGTGKDMAARAIHRLSHRSAGAFVTINCPNLPENILESELFGYRKGAFTHATQDKKGLFLEAQGGTIHLDEIGDISLTLQSKLLRVLQEKEIRPLGQTKSVRIDTRILASTNQDLPAKIRENQFREDLFYRLNVLSIHMPPLRERKEDIPLLVEHFLGKYCKEFRKEPKTVEGSFLRRLMDLPWRGNVRELENFVRRGVLLAPGPVIRAEDLDWPEGSAPVCPTEGALTHLSYREAKARVLDRFHREYLTAVLSRHNGNVTRAARECGLERQALQQVLKRYGISPREVGGGSG